MEKYNIQFKNFMNSLTIDKHREISKKISEACFVDRTRISMWKGGYCKIGPLYRKIICQTIGQDIFE